MKKKKNKNKNQGGEDITVVENRAATAAAIGNRPTAIYTYTPLHILFVLLWLIDIYLVLLKDFDKSAGAIDLPVS